MKKEKKYYVQGSNTIGSIVNNKYNWYSVVKIVNIG
jgi:hypothetical protein